MSEAEEIRRHLVSAYLKSKGSPSYKRGLRKAINIVETKVGCGYWTPYFDPKKKQTHLLGVN